MVAHDSDLALVFGRLAVQLDFVSSEHVAIAMEAWHLDKSKPLGDILHEQGVLSSDEQQLLDGLAQKHLHIHGGDSRKSLAALSTSGLTLHSLGGLPDGKLARSSKASGPFTF